MIKKLIFLVLLISLSTHSQVCSDFPEITATSTTVCSGLSTTLSIVYTPPEICNMNITPTTIPLGNPIPGFTYGGLFNGHYYYVYNTPTTWTQGELICRQNGGYLVCINDINENAFVSNLTNNNIWIGLFRDPTTCNFRWLDCMDITFTNWRPGEPNSGPCGEPYTQIIRGCSFGLNTWNNLDDNSANGSCYSNMVPIMEIDPIIYNNPINATTTYLWSTGETTSSIDVSPNTTTNYWVDITSGSLTCRKNITINVNPQTIAPTGDAIQVFCATPLPTVADLTATGSNIQWYDSASGGNLLTITTPLIDGTIYYASQTISNCESNDRLAVTVNFNDPQITASTTTVCNGTAVNLEVNVVPTPLQGPTWELLIPSTNYNGNQINLSETGYDRNNNYIFSLFKQGSNLITYRFNLNDNTVSNIVTTNIPSNIGPFTYDYSNNRLITGRTGRDPIFAVSANGGAWSQIGTGSFDQESYGAQYYWNSNNQKTGFFGGYGFFAVKNWLWENGGTWTNPFSNNNNCGTTIPAKRNTQLALGVPNTNKIYFFSGQGSCSGQQTANSCNLGSPWATDVGIYCWLKDLWELDLNTYNFTNILPVNNNSITKEGGFVYNYSENAFYIVGGYTPSPTYNSNSGNITNFETSVLKYNPATNTGFVPFNVQGTPPPTVTLNNLGNNKTYFDALNNQIVWIRKDGVWAIKLDSSANSTSLLWSTGEITPTINVTPTTTTTYWVDVTVNGVTCRKEITINVNSTTPAPTGDATQLFCATPAPTVADLTATGSNIQWYDAASGGNLLLNTTALADGVTYYASQSISACESDDRFAVTVSFNDPLITASETTVCSGNSVTLTASTTSSPIANNCTLPTNLQNGLVGYWPFCGNANDESGNGNNGTVNGATLTTDRFGNTNNAYYFSSTGCSTRIDAQVDTSSIQTGLTISIWVLRVGNGCISPRILEFWPSSNPNGPGMAQWGWGNGVNSIGIGSITSTGFSCSAGIPVSGDNIWYNIVYTNDGSFGKFYKDGNLITTVPSIGNPILAGSAAFGRMNHPAFDNLNGKLDDIGVWNRALTQQEITQLYNQVQTDYLWSTGETTPTINPTPATTTTYWVDVTVNGITCRKDITITVNPETAPTFTQLAPICEGATLNALPTTSNNGITGTWSPVIDNTTTTTYTFTPDAGQCATTETMTITVNPNIMPTFNQVAPICSGVTLSALPTTSNNGITGTWSPALDNTTTTTYTFTPDAGQCATTATMTITVNPLPLTPTGNSNQNFCAIDNPTVSDLVVSGSNILWYQSASGGTPLSLNFDLIDGMILYASSIDVVTNCENPTRFPVTIQVENPLLPSISSQQVFCLETNLTLGDIDTNGTVINWYDNAVGGNLVPLTQILNNGDVYYGASVSTISGCESTTRIPLEITIIDSNLSFFNLITIDDNDLNKELIIQGIEQFPNNSIEIYNRYGNLVWSGINYDNITNTFKGMASVSGVVSQGSYLPTGTYFFILSYPNDCEKSELKGFIQINNKR